MKEKLIYNVAFLCILWVGILLIAAMFLYPPWAENTKFSGSNIKGMRPLGYALIWEPPETETSYARGIFIDYGRLMSQITPVVLMVGGALFATRMLFK